MTPGPDERPAAPTGAPTGAARRTVPLTRRPVTDPPAGPSPHPDARERDGGARLWRDRRRAGRLLWGLIPLAVVVQVVGLLLPEGFGVLAGALALAPCPALLLAVGVLTPRPPTGFFRRARAASSSSSAGLDSLFFASIAATVIPQQVIIAWLTPPETGILTSVGITLAASGLGLVLMVAAVGLRERRYRRAERTPLS